MRETRRSSGHRGPSPCRPGPRLQFPIGEIAPECASGCKKRGVGSESPFLAHAAPRRHRDQQGCGGGVTCRDTERGKRPALVKAIAQFPARGGMA